MQEVFKMAEEGIVGLNKLIIPNDSIKSMSRSKKRQYLMITNMLRDLNLLQKLLLFTNNNDKPDEPTESASTTISFFFLKTLISKNHEMWEFMKNEKLNEAKLSNELNELQQQITEFFSDKKKEDLFSFIRNKFGFHYEADPQYKKDIESLIEDAMNNHEMDMWLSNTDSGNEIFGSSNAIMLKVIFERMNKSGFEGDDKGLMDQLFDLTLKISKIFHEFCKLYLIENVLEGIQLEDHGEVEVKAPFLSKVKLPLIVKCDRPKV